MEQSSENIVRRLIELNMERMCRFQNARECTKKGIYGEFLQGLAAQSDGFIMELEYVLKLYEGSVGQAASQPLTDTEFNGPSQNDLSVLLVLFTHEEEALQVYDNLLAKSNDLDNDLFNKIRSQRTDIENSKMQLEKLISV